MPVGLSVSVGVGVAKDSKQWYTLQMIMITKGFCDGLAVSVSSVGWVESGRANSLPCKDGRLDIKLSPDTSTDVSWLDFIDTGTETVVICVAAESYKHAIQ